MLTYIFLLIIIPVTIAADRCPLSLNWDFKKVGTLNSRYLNGSSDFSFTSSEEIVVVNFPQIGKDQAPVQFYQLKNGIWTYNKEISSHLPKTFQARHIAHEDLDNDGIREIIIADHGVDKHPFPGAKPLILKKKPNGWVADPAYLKIASAFTFSTTVIPMPDKSNAIYFANVGFNTPILLRKNKQGGWDNLTKKLPKEIGTNTCLMTALKDDFDKNGIVDLYLGGCDRPYKKEEQTHDRFLVQINEIWKLLPQDVLRPRSKDATWGTNFATSSDINKDSIKDIIYAVHDFGFHNWELWAHINESKPWKFQFKTVKIPLQQEPNTEGFLYSLEEILIPGLGPFFLAQIRSVLRDKNKKDPDLRARFFSFDGSKFQDFSNCLPDMLKKNYLNFKPIPGSKNNLLLLPFRGDVFHLTITKKS